MKYLKKVQNAIGWVNVLVEIKLIFGVMGIISMVLLGIVRDGFDFHYIFECIYTAFHTAVMYFTYKYLKKELEDGTPFTHSGAKELFRLGIMHFALSIIGLAMFSVLVLNDIDADSGYFGYNAWYGISMMILSNVFNYAADLSEINSTEITAEQETEQLQ